MADVLVTIGFITGFLILIFVKLRNDNVYNFRMTLLMLSYQIMEEHSFNNKRDMWNWYHNEMKSYKQMTFKFWIPLKYKYWLPKELEEEIDKFIKKSSINKVYKIYK